MHAAACDDLCVTGRTSIIIIVHMAPCMLRPCVHASSIPLLDGVAVRELIQGPNLAA